MEAHLATVWESVADAMGDHAAVVQGDLRRSWSEFDDRAARLAAAFAAAGVGPGSKVALYLHNGPEYLEGYYAALKMRAVPVNVNYRYLDDELLYLLDNSDAEVLVFDRSLAERVARVRERAPKLKLLLEAGEEYEAHLAAHEPAPRISRSPDDITMIFTGGTTGMPKGVMSKIGPGLAGLLVSTPTMVGEAPVAEVAEVAAAASRYATEGRPIVSLPACPLMHATGLSIGAVPALTFGGTVVLLESPGLDTAEVWGAVERERVLSLTIVGDAFARPLLRELDSGPTGDLSSLRLICSAGAMFSTEVKQALLAHLPDVRIVDFMAATEGGMGLSVATADRPAETGRFYPSPGVKVFTADDHEVGPGSGESGMVAVPGVIPSGYYKDQDKTDRTFRVIDGVRYSFPGDWATVGSDGTLTLLGRGSGCINTGGEKVFPEEVEEALKRHPAVEDSLVFGVPDERFGQRVVGVASSTDAALAVDDVLRSLKEQLSGYKVPRELLLVPEVPRAANGKADYPTAKRMFEAAKDGSRT